MEIPSMKWQRNRGGNVTWTWCEISFHLQSEWAEEGFLFLGSTCRSPGNLSVSQHYVDAGQICQIWRPSPRVQLSPVTPQSWSRSPAMLQCTQKCAHQISSKIMWLQYTMPHKPPAKHREMTQKEHSEYVCNRFIIITESRISNQVWNNMKVSK